MSLELLKLGEIPPEEVQLLDDFIHQYRNEIIRPSEELVKTKLEEHKEIADAIKNKDVSNSIFELRDLVWKEFLKDEFRFNSFIMKELPNFLKTPKEVIDELLSKELSVDKPEILKKEIIDACGGYAGFVYPYLYRISLSNTQSRRSRAGRTFEAIIYAIYEILNYPFDSQSKVGSRKFKELGLGKKVDSVLPDIDAFQNRRNKSIIGTMKTTLRERWQEVAEEIERTKIPEIHLITVDEDISQNKAAEMAQYNITVVNYKWVAESETLKDAKSIISFEEYFFEEIPQILKYWDPD